MTCLLARYTDVSTVEQVTMMAMSSPKVRDAASRAEHYSGGDFQCWCLPVYEKVGGKYMVVHRCSE